MPARPRAEPADEPNRPQARRDRGHGWLAVELPVGVVVLGVLDGSVLVPEVVVVLDGSVLVGDVVVPDGSVLVGEVVVPVPEVVSVPVVVDGSVGGGVVVAVPVVGVGAGAGPTAAPPVVAVVPVGAGEGEAGVGSTVGSDWVWVRPGSAVFAFLGSAGVAAGVVEVVDVLAPALLLPGVVEVFATVVAPWVAMRLAAAEMAPVCLAVCVAEEAFRVVAGRGLTEVRASAEGVATGAEDSDGVAGPTAAPVVTGAWAATVAVWWRWAVL